MTPVRAIRDRTRRQQARRPPSSSSERLKGSMGVDFKITPGLEAVWGYTPSFKNMRAVLDVFTYSRELVNDELAEVRYRASTQPGFQESFGSMFPAPRQEQVEARSTPAHELKKLPLSAIVLVAPPWKYPCCISCVTVSLSCSR
jgi:hypothetical protein